MYTSKFFGNPPYQLLILDGGPGAYVEVAPIAEELSNNKGVIEPRLLTFSIEDKLNELYQIIASTTKKPVILIGFSWGAWLAFLFTGRYPDLISKLILISSPPFEGEYENDIIQTRLDRLRAEDKKHVLQIIETIKDTSSAQRINEFTKLLSYFYKTDTYHPNRDLRQLKNSIQFDHSQYFSLWHQANEMRKNGTMLLQGSMIQSPVIVIHGDYDPHPFNGVKIPLQHILGTVDFILLKRCGH